MPNLTNWLKFIFLLSRFMWTNLDQYVDGEVYIPTITLRGNVSEKSVVNIIVNKGTDYEHTYLVETTDSGYFLQEIELSRFVVITAESDQDSASLGIDRRAPRY